jgi:hypothetical protein
MAVGIHLALKPPTVRLAEDSLGAERLPHRAHWSNRSGALPMPSSLFADDKREEAANHYGHYLENSVEF